MKTTSHVVIGLLALAAIYLIARGFYLLNQQVRYSWREDTKITRSQLI